MSPEKVAALVASAPSVWKGCTFAHEDGWFDILLKIGPTLARQGVTIKTVKEKHARLEFRGVGNQNALCESFLKKASDKSTDICELCGSTGQLYYSKNAWEQTRCRRHRPSQEDEAHDAKMVLRKRLGRPEWLRGVGVSHDDKGYFIKVNVAEITNDVKAAIPDQVDDVRIQLEVMGEILPLDAIPPETPSQRTVSLKPGPLVEDCIDLQFVPEPYKSMIAKIKPTDLYLVQELPSGEVAKISQVPEGATALELDVAEGGLRFERDFTLKRVRGEHLRSFLVALARAHEHFIPPQSNRVPVR